MPVAGVKILSARVFSFVSLPQNTSTSPSSSFLAATSIGAVTSNTVKHEEGGSLDPKAPEFSDDRPFSTSTANSVASSPEATSTSTRGFLSKGSTGMSTIPFLEVSLNPVPKLESVPTKKEDNNLLLLASLCAAVSLDEKSGASLDTSSHEVNDPMDEDDNGEEDDEETADDMDSLEISGALGVRGGDDSSIGSRSAFTALDRRGGSSKLISKSKWYCHVCNAMFPSLQDLVNHSSEHLPANESASSSPSSSFESTQAAERVPTIRRFCCCPVCGKEFTKNAHLTSHLRIHTGERPYKCNLCSKTFTQKSTLNRHARVHTGEKPFPCGICGKRFAQQSTLTSHLRTHTGERPYRCASCGKRFNKSGHLYRHCRVVHRGSVSPSVGAIAGAVQPPVVAAVTLGTVESENL